jgi:hypothetical protein
MTVLTKCRQPAFTTGNFFSDKYDDRHIYRFNEIANARSNTGNGANWSTSKGEAT